MVKGNNFKIINGDALKKIKKMHDNSVQHTITSPPYNMNLRVSNNKYISRQIVPEISTKYANFSDNLTMEEYYEFTKNILNELLRVTEKYIFYNIQFITGNKRALFKIIGEFNEFLKEVIIWNKGYGQPAIASGVLNSHFELILIFTKDKTSSMKRQFKDSNFSRGKLGNLWNIKRGRSKIPNHSAVFPNKLVKEIIKNFTKKNEIIFDPFMGTGTSGIVSLKNKRKYIGIELIKEYYNFSKKQLKKIDNSIIKNNK